MTTLLSIRLSLVCSLSCLTKIPLPPAGLPRANFENRDVTYQYHIVHDHKVWNYLYL